VPYAIDRYTAETRRISSLLDTHLASREFFEGDYSIADISHFGWLGFLRQVGVSFAEWPHLTAWLDRVGARPAVVRGMCVPHSVRL
jgi:glutathione S-transferase